MKYTVDGSVTVSVSVTVEAGSEEEAREMAGNWNMPELCHQCSGSSSEQFGDPTDVEDLPFSFDTDGTPQWGEVKRA